MIEVFGFNTTNGGVFEMHNTTVEEIKSALKERFPKWSNDVIDKVIANQNYYKPVVPMKKSDDADKKAIKRGSIAKESICINGYELNPILSLGQSIHVFHKNAYRYWGTVTDKFFSNQAIASKYESFEKKYDDVVVAIKSKPRASKQVITQKVLEMCYKMDDLKEVLDKSGYLQQDTDKEYISGSGRKLGIGELMNRVGEMSGDCSAALK